MSTCPCSAGVDLDSCIHKVLIGERARKRESERKDERSPVKVVSFDKMWWG